METFEILTLLGGIMIGGGVLLLIIAAVVAYLLGEIE
jgi:LPS O-antigen subunit length determinant protein (WzzB/FepE family)